MAKKETWIVWLAAGAGETLLGLPTASTGRFRAIGEVEETSTMGVWMEVKVFQELTVPGNDVSQQWTVAPKTCFIHWSYIAYIQKGDKTEGAGFTLVKSK
jgi:hypothetical protein